MSKVLITETTLSDIADAIRRKLNTTNTYKPSEMGRAIRSIIQAMSFVSSAVVVQDGNVQTIQDGSVIQLHTLLSWNNTVTIQS